MKVVSYNKTNYYLIPCDSGYMLIDAGWVGKFKLLTKKLKSIEIKLSDIKYILLTHHHHDHAALVQDLKKASGAKLILHKKQIPFIKNGVTNNKILKQYNKIIYLLDRVVSPFIKYDYKKIKVSDSDIIISDDNNEEILKNIGINGRIISTPGHTSDSISLILNDGKAFVGDLMMNVMPLISKPPLPIEAESYLEVNESISKIISMGGKKIYPAHGSVIQF